MVIVYDNQMLKENLWVNVDGFLTNYNTCCLHVGGLVLMLKRKFKYILVHYCSNYILTNNLCSVNIDLGTCCYASSNITLRLSVCKWTSLPFLMDDVLFYCNLTPCVGHLWFMKQKLNFVSREHSGFDIIRIKR